MNQSFDFTFSGMMSGILFGGIGLWLYRRGRALSDLEWTVLGLLLMIYPYFASGPVLDWGIGIALCSWAYVRKPQ